MSRVDVVIPCYNYAYFLRACVESVLTQRGVDVRVLILDDASPDHTPAICEELAAQDSRVEFRRHTVNQGHIATYNEGLLGWAASEYSLLLSADDALAPGALARATHVMERHREVGMTYGMALIVGNDESHASTAMANSDDYRIVSGSEFLRHCFVEGNAVETPTAVVRTSLQHRLGGYRSDLPHSGDMEMWMRFAVHSPVGVLRAVQGYVRQHGANMKLQYFGQILSDRREVIQACERILTQWGAQFPESDLWRESMLKRISEESCWEASRAFDMGDMEKYRTCLEFAEQVYPNHHSSNVWRRLQAKRLLGHALWRKLRPALSSLRGIRKTPLVQQSTSHCETVRSSGWWPGSP